MPTTLFSGGGCPYCPGYCDVFLVGLHGDPGLIFYCPGCGCACEASGPFSESLLEHDVDTLAPNGLRHPTQAEVASVPGVEEAHPDYIEIWLRKVQKFIPAAPP